VIITVSQIVVVVRHDGGTTFKLRDLARDVESAPRLGDRVQQRDAAASPTILLFFCQVRFSRAEEISRGRTTTPV
jgi:hypothetical protein